MLFQHGFEIEVPKVLVPWGINEIDLARLLPLMDLKKVSDGYYSLNARCFGGHDYGIGFHFDTQKGGNLKEIELFSIDGADPVEAYKHNAEILEKALGPPTETRPSVRGLVDRAWVFGATQVFQCLLDRYDLEERISIRHWES